MDNITTLFNRIVWQEATTISNEKDNTNTKESENKNHIKIGPLVKNEKKNNSEEITMSIRCYSLSLFVYSRTNEWNYGVERKKKQKKSKISYHDKEYKRWRMREF